MADPARPVRGGAAGPVRGGAPVADGAVDDDTFEDAADGGVAPAPAALAAHDIVVTAAGSGLRLDKYLALRLPELSRSRLQRWIADGAVRLNGVAVRGRASVFAGDRIALQERAAPEQHAHAPEPVAFTVVWEDDTLIVIDKPAGLVVHPGAGNWSGTLLNGLLAYDPRLAALPRAGIVHRLDAGTSGLMVVARTSAAQLDLVRQLQQRSVVREYWALVAGAVAPNVTIDAALARDPRNPLRFRVSRAAGARPARTYVRCLAQWPLAGTRSVLSWVVCRLDTGRTHQIRVHLESLGHPLVGDPLYRRHLPAAMLAQHLPGLDLGHQALHACRLALVHPVRREPLSWTRPPPEDLYRLLRALGASAAQLQPAAQGYFRTPGCGQTADPVAGDAADGDD